MRRVLCCALAFAASASAQDQLAILVSNLFETSTEPLVPLNSVVNLASSALGVVPVSSEGVRGGVRGGVRARANVVVAMPLGADAIDKYELSNLQTLRREHPSVRVSSPYNLYDATATLATGQALPGKANLADVLLQTFGGASLTVSASSSEPLASLFAHNPSLTASNDYTLTLDEQGFRARNGVWPFEMAAEEITTIGQQIASAAGVSVSPIHSTLLAELAYATNLPLALHNHQLVVDDVPDAFSFVLNGLDNIATMKGTSSQEYAAGLRLLDTAMPLIVSNFETVYRGSVATEVVMLGSPDHGVSAFARRLMQVPNDTNNTNNTYPSDAEVIKFHIVLWVSIGLSFATLFAVYSIGGMNFKKDTLLYSSFNPKWEGGDARKHR